MTTPHRQVAVVVGATSKWQADGRNTKLAHGRELDDSGLPVEVRWGVGGALAQKFAAEGFLVVLTLASLALGMVLAILSQTESQAVQFAMLALLAGLFFSGFILSIEGLQYPVKVISWLLPVTYGITSLQDVMLRGRDPAPERLAGLAALVVGYGAVAVIGLRRRLRVSTT